MNNKEIRIGNLINRNGLIVTVDEQTFWDMIHNTEQYEPVKITEDWLLKFGFEKYEFDNVQYPQYRWKNRLIVVRHGCFVDYGTSVQLKYVHKLQNLYFALTGEELTTKN
jgi:hypothetical protein